MNSKRWLTVFGLVVFGFHATSAYAGHEERVFDNRSVRGAYGVSLSGSAYIPVPGAPTPQLVQVAAVGRFVADGYGNITEGVRNISINGTHYVQTYVCTYQVQADGTGNADCTILETGLTETFFVDLNNKAREIQFVATTPGTIVTGVARKQ